jgi:hypothetical protein
MVVRNVVRCDVSHRVFPDPARRGGVVLARQLLSSFLDRTRLAGSRQLAKERKVKT